MFEGLKQIVYTALTNQFAVGGIALTVLGGIVYYLRFGATYVWGRVRRYFYTEVEIRSGFLLDNLAEYLESTKQEQPRVSFYHGRSEVLWNMDGTIFSVTNSMEPGTGTHKVKYKNKTIWMSKQKEKIENNQSYNNTFGMYLEYVTLGVFSFNGLKVLQEFQDELCSNGIEKSKQKKVVYSYMNMAGGWAKASELDKREFRSLALPEGMEEKVNADIERFFTSKEEYDRRGTPWKRGYLFFGPPGTGKTSISKAICTTHRLNMYVLSLGAKDMTDSVLQYLLSNVPVRSLVLIDDIDEQMRNGSLLTTLSGLLQGMDGAISSKGVIFVLNTNNPELLSPKLVRAGRIDRKYLLGNASTYQVNRLVEIFYPDLDGEVKAKFVESVPDGKVSPARLQEYLATNLETPERLLLDIGELFVPLKLEPVEDSPKEPSNDPEGFSFASMGQGHHIILQPPAAVAQIAQDHYLKSYGRLPGDPSKQ